MFKAGDWVEWKKGSFGETQYPLMRVVGRRRYPRSKPGPAYILCFVGVSSFFHSIIQEHWLAPASLPTFLCYRHLFDEGETSADVCQGVGAFGRHHRPHR